MKACDHGRIKRNCYFCFTSADYEFITGNGSVDYPLIDYIEKLANKIDSLEARVEYLEAFLVV